MLSYVFAPPEPPYVSILGFPIYYYGVILALAIFVGIVVSNRLAMQKYFLYGLIPKTATAMIIGGIVGARLYYCILNIQYYTSYPLEILNIRGGGLSIHGAILGGLIVLLYQSRKNNISFGKICDIYALGLPLGQAIGRWGNFFNSEAFGTPTNLIWKMYVSPEFRPERYANSQYFHPTFLYESVLDLVIFVILYKLVLPKEKDNIGVISGWYLILYSTVRFFIERIRVDCTSYLCEVPTPCIISIMLFTVGVLLVAKKHTQNI